MKIKDNKTGMYNVLMCMFDDPSTKVEFGTDQKFPKHTILIITADSDKYHWMLEELNKDVKTMSDEEYNKNRPINDIEYKPLYKCQRFIFKNCLMYELYKMLGSGQSCIKIRCDMETITYRTMLDVIKEDLNIGNGSIISREAYWRHKDVFDESNVSFTPVNYNTMQMFFPAEWKECKYRVSLDEQNSVCSKHNIYWCRKERCEEVE